MAKVSAARGGHVDLAWIGLGVINELGNGLCRKRWIYEHDEGRAEDARDWRYVTDEIEIELVVECRVDRIERAGEEQGIAVSRGAYDRFGANIAGRASPILNYELLSDARRQPLADEASDDVIRASGRIADDQAHRPRRISLRPCNS